VFSFNALVWKPLGEIYENTYQTLVATDTEEKTMSEEKATSGE
jgi:hypothetical protein